MYTSFSIENFRCFEKFNLRNLKRINLFAGLNNVGKTSLLEAFFLHCGSNNPALVLNINAFRGIDVFKVLFGQWNKAPWNSLFYNYDTNKEVKLQGKGSTLYTSYLKIKIANDVDKIRLFSEGSDSKLELTKVQSNIVPDIEGHELKFVIIRKKEKKEFSLILDAKGAHKEPGTPISYFPAFFLSSRSIVPPMETVDRFSNLIKMGRIDSLLEVLKIIEPKLKKLEILVEYGMPMIHGYLGFSKPIPLPLMGEGMVKLANLVLMMVNAESGVVLIDEIENGIHHSNMEQVWDGLNKISKEFKTQVFASTHSFECIKAAHNAFLKNNNYDFCLIRLEGRQEQIQPVYYKKDTLSSALEFGFEVR